MRQVFAWYDEGVGLGRIAKRIVREELADVGVRLEATSEGPRVGVGVCGPADGRLGHDRRRYRSDAASAGVRRALTEVTAKPDRLDLLKAAVTIYLEEGKIEVARDAVTEFEEITAELMTPVIEAETSAVRGALALSEGDPGSALPLLRRAAGTWQEQDAPHEVAKLNVLIGQACRALADHDGARLEFSAARETFERLGARPDLAQLDRIVAAADAGSEIQGLTRREIEVLCLIARGKANRAIANELHLSERTVHRHVSNIFTKLEISSRKELRGALAAIPDPGGVTTR